MRKVRVAGLIGESTLQTLHWVQKVPSIIVVKRKPKRVWTIIMDSKPSLPIKPIHNVNAFLEDHLSDWVMVDPFHLRYFSRITSGEVWVLLEF